MTLVYLCSGALNIKLKLKIRAVLLGVDCIIYQQTCCVRFTFLTMLTLEHNWKCVWPPNRTVLIERVNEP
jgi:hypothetical protein